MVIGAHSSMAEQPAHNRLGLGSSPGGPTIVLERLLGLNRGWPEIESGGAVVLERLLGLNRGWPEIESGGAVVLERLLGLNRGWPEIESGGSARRVDRVMRRSLLPSSPRSPLLSSFRSSFLSSRWSSFLFFFRWFFGSFFASGYGFVGRVNRSVMNDTMESTWILNCKH